MAKSTLPKGAVKLINQAVDKIFDRVLARFLERPPVDKRLYIGFKPRVTLPSLFRGAAASEHTRADQTILDGLMDVAKGFLDAQRERTKAHTVKAVQSWLSEAHAGGVKTDLDTVLGGELAQVFGKAHDGVKRILETESTVARNTGTLDGIVKVNAYSGIEDPVVYFVVVRDSSLCDDCKRLHLLDDETTPRVWKLSELGHGYFKKGGDRPCVGGLHPHCRCSLVTLMPGYGFDGSGMVDWISLDHDEMAKQRGTKKREYDWGEGLFKTEPVVIIEEPAPVAPTPLAPLVDENGKLVVGDKSAYKAFRLEKAEGVFVAFKAANTGFGLEELSKVVVDATQSVEQNARIFLTGKTFKIFVSDRDHADNVVKEIQSKLLDEEDAKP